MAPDTREDPDASFAYYRFWTESYVEYRRESPYSPHWPHGLYGRYPSTVEEKVAAIIDNTRWHFGMVNPLSPSTHLRLSEYWQVIIGLESLELPS